MKKFLLSAALICSAAVALVSCDNGAYDANPDANNGNIPNPLNPTTNVDGHTLGNMSAKVNGTLVGMPGYALDTMGFLSILATKAVSPYNSFRVIFFSYQGKKVYDIAEGVSSGAAFGYSIMEGTNVKFYSAQTGDAKSHIKLEVTEDSDNKYKGTFEGVVYNTTTGTTNPNDSLVITEGKFYVNKK